MYIEQTWNNGDVITSAKMNHIEDGIANAQSTADGAASSVNALSANGAIGTQNLANGAVTDAKLASNAVTTAKVADGAVTMPKLGADVLEELDTKADIDGSYESMTVGNAEQLISSVGITDQTPYNFRTSGGSAEIGDREELNAVVGLSVPWNQLLNPTRAGASGTYGGVTVTRNGDGSITFNGTATANATYSLSSSLSHVETHKYFMGGYKKVGNNTGYISHVGLGLDKGNGCVFSAPAASSAMSVFVVIKSGDVFDNVTMYPILVNLTLLFGSTIADYIYSLEQSNAGAGVAWFRKYFPKLYYGYSGPTMQSVKTSAHKTIGFNQWDEEWELGYYNVDTGASSASNSQIRCKNKIKVVPNTTYYIKTSSTLWILEYDADDIYLNKYTSKTNQVFTTSANTQYIRFYALSSYGTTYKHDICINLHWDGERDGEYEPYEAHTYALDDVELRGILKLDASNNLYADGDRYLPDGTVERNAYEDTLTVSSMYTRNDASYDFAVCQLSHGYYGLNSATANVIGEKVVANTQQKGYTSADIPIGTVLGYSLEARQIAIAVAKGTTKAQAESVYNGSKICYRINTPFTETADPYTQTQIVDDFGTEEFVDAAVEANERDVAIPVGNETVYKANLRAKLEMAPDSPDGDGDYIVRQTNGQNSYIPLVEVKELPDMPSSDGAYKLRCTVSNGTATLSWVSDS